MFRHGKRLIRSGFSFVEVLVVTGIIGGSIAIMLPRLLEVRAESLWRQDQTGHAGRAGL